MEAYAYTDSHVHNQKLKQAIKSTEKLTKHIENIKKDSKTESDKLTLELLDKSQIMMEALKSTN